ncbi:MAG: TldD/PmbA family protein [Methanocalculus sp. MSAO_Arc1]|uniref:TldD/PmbA family protein n=1 Tax=Methanocalculus TaxID=71151 RepID=UPI000FED3433|nr:MULTISPECIES: TldD/PmbA family protein [unclassified Methanocalculus]MCP1661390.1 TldD protein [Methanocalculus sp. AMF5]RQD79698.1 MAG: TldD/PmbA family protein [Methanocalculus sp. MSAO_Arc1]
MDAGLRYWDVRHVAGEHTGIDIDNGEIESSGVSFFSRAIIRALGPRGWGIVSVAPFDPDDKGSLSRYLARAEKAAAVTSEDVRLAEPGPRTLLPVPRVIENPSDVPLEEKAALLKAITDAASLAGVSNTRGNYIERLEEVRFLDSTGYEASYTTCRSGFSVMAVAKENGEMQMGYVRDHAIDGLNLRNRTEDGIRAGRRALDLLQAQAVHGGRMKAVLNPELGGVFAHEAVGHASEGDLVKEGASVLKGQIGELIGSPATTIIDDPTMHGFGFEPVDAEGVAGSKTAIIENGVLKRYLHSRETLAAVGSGDAGHARAMPGDLPIVRMSNTYIAPGDWTYEEIIEECRDGILLAGSRGGQVDPGRGVFQFNAEYGYLIEGGELKGMVRDVSLSGEILSTLHAISLCGNDLNMFPGYCGKGGQTVPVSDGSPHILLSEAIVGGSAGV